MSCQDHKTSRFKESQYKICWNRKWTQLRLSWQSQQKKLKKTLSSFSSVLTDRKHQKFDAHLKLRNQKMFHSWNVHLNEGRTKSLPWRYSEFLRGLLVYQDLCLSRRNHWLIMPSHYTQELLLEQAVCLDSSPGDTWTHHSETWTCKTNVLSCCWESGAASVQKHPSFYH